MSAARPPASGGALSISLASATRVWQRNLWVYSKRWAYALVPNFFEPVFYLLGMGLGLGYYVTLGGGFGDSFLAYIAPGLVAAAAMNGAAFEATYNVFVKLNFARLYDAMIATRVNAEDVVVGELLWATTRATAYGAVFLLITLFFDSPLSWRLVPAVAGIALVGFCFSAIGMAFTATIKTIEVFSYFFTMFLTPLFLFSDIFFPVHERFPPALAALAEWTPLYRGVQLVRGLVNGTGEPLWGHALYLLALGSLLSTYSVWRMRRRLVR